MQNCCSHAQHCMILCSQCDTALDNIYESSVYGLAFWCMCKRATTTANPVQATVTVLVITYSAHCCFWLLNRLTSLQPPAARPHVSPCLNKSNKKQSTPSLRRNVSFCFSPFLLSLFRKPFEGADKAEHKYEEDMEIYSVYTRPVSSMRGEARELRRNTEAMRQTNWSNESKLTNTDCVL